MYGFALGFGLKEAKSNSEIGFWENFDQKCHIFRAIESRLKPISLFTSS